MKLFVVLAVLAVSATASPLDEWYSFKQTHGKRYKNTLEEVFRMNVFMDNKKLIEEHNKDYENGLVSYHMEMNHFGDLTFEEFRQQMTSTMETSPARNSLASVFVAPDNVYIPETVDWREKGAVTPVKNQGQCGSCWAFSTTGSLEGQHFLKTGELVGLSEQNLVDCDREQNNGCHGGTMNDAFEYIRNNGGIDTEDTYPYMGRELKCRFKKQNVGATVTGYTEIEQGSEEALKKAVATVGPVSVGIRAGIRSFQFYNGGVYYDRACNDELDHGVLLVGYGTEDGEDYWLVKNSWGPSWGEDGYIKIARNRNNLCGISNMASYPLV